MSIPSLFSYTPDKSAPIFSREDTVEYSNGEMEVVEGLYSVARDISDGNKRMKFNEDIISNCSIIIDQIQKNKSVVSALITSLLKKIISPTQDIRLHRVEFPGGYSARSLDTEITAPFFKKYFPRYANKESAFLTLATREAIPWTLEDGIRLKIRSKILRPIFLQVLDDVEKGISSAQEYIVVIFLHLINLSAHETKILETVLAADTAGTFTISDVIALLDRFFTQPNSSRLPVVAIYTIYQLLLPVVSRYSGKTLVPLNIHTSPDKHSYGDIEIYDNEAPYEILEIKHNIAITRNLIADIFQKTRGTSIQRYFILTTHTPGFSTDEERQAVENLCRSIKAEYSLEVIPNGIISTIKYYLRFVDNYRDFLRLFTQNLVEDAKVSTETTLAHIELWQSLILRGS